MKVIEGFTMRRLGNEHIIVGEGANLINFNKMIALNSSAAYLWESIQGKEFVAEDLRDLLLAKYDVESSVAEEDAVKIAESWIEAGIVSR